MHSTPFLQAPLIDLMGQLSNFAMAQQILDGSFVCPPEVEPNTQTFIQSLVMPDHITPISLEITKEDFIGF